MSVDIRALKEFKEHLQSISEGFQVFVEKFLLNEANKVLNLTKNNTPYDTGRLRAAWILGDVKRRGDTLEVSIINNVEYASYVEYGHKVRGGGGWKDGVFMCTLSIDEIEKRMPKDFKIAFEGYLRSLGSEG